MVRHPSRLGNFGPDKLESMWNRFDADHSGDIDPAELEKLIGAIAAGACCLLLLLLTVP